MQTFSGTIHDNPWAGVNTSESNEEDLEGNQDESANAAAAASAVESSTRLSGNCTDRTLYTVVQVFLCADVCQAVLLLVYSSLEFLQRRQHSKEATATTDDDPHHLHAAVDLWAPPDWLLFLMWQWGLAVAIRGVSVTGALYYSSILERCGFLIASYISLLSSVEAGVAAVAVAVGRRGWKDSWTHVLQQLQAHHPTGAAYHHSWNLVWRQVIQQILIPYGWLLFVVVAVLQVVRWFLYQSYRERLLQQEQDDLTNTALLAQSSIQQRPWWWNSSSHRDTNDGSLRQPLLSETSNSGLPEWAQERTQWEMVVDPSDPDQAGPLLRPVLSTQQPAGASSSRGPSRNVWNYLWPFRGGRDTGRDTDNLRDDGSVDFTSVQEEWASRTEEDPLWWSRDAGEANSNNNNKSTDRPATFANPNEPSPTTSWDKGGKE